MPTPDWRAVVRSHLPSGGLPPDREADIVEELAQQLEQTYDDAVKEGDSAPAALERALSALGSWPTLARAIVEAERSPATRSLSPLAREPGGASRVARTWRALWHDGRHALRLFIRHRAFAATATLTLALTIGATTAIFSLVNVVLFQPLAFDESDRLVMVSEAVPELGFHEIPFSPPDLLDYQAAQHSFAGMGAFRSTQYELGGGIGEGERVDAAKITASLLDVLRITPALGRRFSEEEDGPGHDVAILSHGLWQRRFGGAPDVTGRTVLLDRRPFTIVGVMPASLTFPPAGLRYAGPAAEVFVPMAFDEHERTERGGNFNNSTIARLRPGVSLEQSRAEAQTLAARILANYPPQLMAQFKGARLLMVLTPLHEQVVGASKPVLLVMFGTVAVLLLVGCANVGNLMLSLAAHRRRELALRSSLGAERGRLIRQLFAESLVLAMAGGALGLLIAQGIISSAPGVLPPSTPRLDELRLDTTALIFTAGLCIITAVLFGLLPGFQSSRVDLRTVLADAGRGTTSTASRRLRSALVVSQCAMAIVLLAAAGLLLRSFMSLLATETGFRPDQALAISTNLPGGGYPNAADVRRFYSDAVERIRRLPGVVATGISTDLPLLATEMRGVVIEGRDGMGAGVPPVVVHSWIAGDYLQALGVRLLRGRHLTPADRAGSTLVAIVSETAALEFWRGEDAIGKRFRWAGEDAPWRTVVGVVADVKDTDLGERPRPHSYTPVWQETDERIGETLIGMFRSPHLVLSTVGDPMSLAGPARSALRTIDAHLASGDIGPLTTHVSRTLTTRRVAALLVGGFALAALLLAGLGLHGVLAYNVSQRRQEIGIRMALGAARQDVMRLVVRDGLRMAIVGLGIGIAAALSVTGLLRGLLYDVTATDPLTFVAVSAALLAVACAATYVPARQAVTVDPAVTMRET